MGNGKFPDNQDSFHSIDGFNLDIYGYGCIDSARRFRRLRGRKRRVRYVFWQKQGQNYRGFTQEAYGYIRDLLGRDIDSVFCYADCLSGGLAVVLGRF